MLDLLRGKRPDTTVHGFRSSFRDWAAERTSYPNHVAEAALAHTIGDKVDGLARPQEHPAHGALHRTCAGSIKTFWR
jgi:integrase